MHVLYRDDEFGDSYIFNFMWVRPWHGWLTGAGHYEIRVLESPKAENCGVPLTDLPPDESGRLTILGKDQHLVTTVERATLIARIWMALWSRYVRNNSEPDEGTLLDGGAQVRWARAMLMAPPALRDALLDSIAR